MPYCFTLLPRSGHAFKELDGLGIFGQANHGLFPARAVSGAPTTAIVDLATSGAVYLVSLDEAHTSDLLDASPDYSAYTIPAGTY